ncbi:MAG: signal peptidase I [Oscillospiraceae bacterium]|nr:signal peptidase I [Oscillospiraceae bacterium]
MSQSKQEKSTVNHKVLTAVGVLLCVILIPILVVNITLIVKSYTNKDEVPKIGGYAPLIVLTGSMEPNIMSGDLIIVKQIDGNDVKKDDVIAFFDPDGNGTSILTHRVNEIYEEDGTLYFKTQGDANNAEDRKPVSEDKLVGIYTDVRIAGAGSVAMFMQTTAGLVICVVVPLVLLVAWDLLRRKKYEKKNQQDTDALLAELEALKAAKEAEQKDEDLQ